MRKAQEKQTKLVKKALSPNKTKPKVEKKTSSPEKNAVKEPTTGRRSPGFKVFTKVAVAPNSN